MYKFTDATTCDACGKDTEDPILDIVLGTAYCNPLCAKQARTLPPLRLGNVEAGIARGGWLFGRTLAACGCTLYDFGPFYLTILRGDCASSK